MIKISPGFTLVEMAVVLLIIGLLIGGLLVPLSVQIDQSRLNATEQSLQDIKEALIGFAIVDGRLPCPAVSGDDGVEDSGLCGDEGFLPWATLALNIGKSDVWGAPFRYRVDTRYTTQPFPDDPPDTSSGLVVQDNTQPTPVQLVAPESNSTSRVIAIIFSYGKDGQANGQNGGTIDQVYAQDVYIENQFDDRLIWLAKSILINRLAVAGKWPPS
ncbi:MAG: hypothetical protein DRR19_28370 [Candidatus Parabeggiatoa sp. nov. 1]|nr:MAG: hypothetical protein DRR19_28370 [Gammaproteobacteria bacterium]